MQQLLFSHGKLSGEIFDVCLHAGEQTWLCAGYFWEICGRWWREGLPSRSLVELEERVDKESTGDLVLILPGRIHEARILLPVWSILVL